MMDIGMVNSETGSVLAFITQFPTHDDDTMVYLLQLVERIIPALEHAHSPSYQALIMVDNSQGHSAYSTDALLTSRMNMKPYGKQARMQDGWYMENGLNGVQVAQKCVSQLTTLNFFWVSQRGCTRYLWNEAFGGKSL